jgi:hypothetical protein
MNPILRRRTIILGACLAFAGVMGLAQRDAGAILVRRGAVYRPRPVARAVVATTAVVATAAVVGSVVRSLPPSCSSVMVGNVAYQQCGNSWYEPRYSGSEVTYVVVNPPH